MKTWKKTLTLAVAAVVCTPAAAQQSEDELALQMRDAERRLQAEETERAEAQREMERVAEVIANEALVISQQREVETEEVQMRMREAERRMAEAARQMAELSMRKLPRVERIEKIVRANRGPVLGVTIGATDEAGPVEGVEILGVTPGGAAEEAGLRAGDVITSINDESLTADSADEATEKLLDFMKGVEAGDELDIEFLRNGKSESVALEPREIDRNVFAFQFDGDDFVSPDFDVHVAPRMGGSGPSYFWIGGDRNFGDMEMVKLTEKLGSYFGTDEGLLVVRAPSNEDLKLEDGDVILSIDGRKPSSVEHAVRILGSYQGGEALSIEIMRDKRKRTIEIEMPDNRRSWTAPALAPRVVVAPRKVILNGAERT
ncbi:MAG: PDZ domain-containing protein [Gammaproteobacteria bacterium]|nr:PDZ domain-containing protein [Gammaproteobacteria bacterium]